MEFCHPCVGEILSTAHGIGKVDAPAVPFIDVCQSSGDTTFRHDGVCFTEQGFAHESNFKVADSGFNGSAKSSTTRSDY